MPSERMNYNYSLEVLPIMRWKQSTLWRASPHCIRTADTCMLIFSISIPIRVPCTDTAVFKGLKGAGPNAWHLIDSQEN